jgi:hypothetical protein
MPFFPHLFGWASSFSLFLIFVSWTWFIYSFDFLFTRQLVLAFVFINPFYILLFCCFLPGFWVWGCASQFSCTVTNTLALFIQGPWQGPISWEWKCVEKELLTSGQVDHGGHRSSHHSG